MYLNIGNDMAVREKSVIGIFDLDNTSTSKRTRAFLEAAEKEGQVVPCDELPKSFVVCSACRKADRPRQDRIYIAQMAPATLKKRSNGI